MYAIRSYYVPVDSDRLLFPISRSAPSWPYLLLGLVLAGLVVVLFLYRPRPLPSEPVGMQHFKFLFWGVAGYLVSLFIPSVLWFPSDKSRMVVDSGILAWESLRITSYNVCYTKLLRKVVI